MVIEKEKKIRRQDAWNARNGLVTRSYKLQQSIADRFAAACETAGTSKKKQLEKMMTEYADEIEKRGKA